MHTPKNNRIDLVGISYFWVWIQYFESLPTLELAIVAATTSVVASVTTLTSNGDVQSKNQKKVQKNGMNLWSKLYQNLPLILASVVAAALLFRKPPQ